MGFFDGWGQLQHLGDLPLWRKLLLGCIVGLWVLLGNRHVSKAFDIYASAPHNPVPETKQVYPVHVEGGYLRYVTKKDAEEWEYLKTTTGSIIGVLALTMGLLLVLPCNPRSRRC
jgi:hypothetical protein